MSRTCSSAGAPDANALIAIKSLGTTALLLLVVPLQPARKQHSKHADRIEDPTTSDHATPTSDEPQAMVPFLNFKTTNIIRAGLELGVYSAVGSILQAWGLARVPATAAGFLVQFTSVITPAVAVLAGQTISRRTQIAIVVAFAGTLMTAFDNAMARGRRRRGVCRLCGDGGTWQRRDSGGGRVLFDRNLSHRRSFSRSVVSITCVRCEVA